MAQQFKACVIFAENPHWGVTLVTPASKQPSVAFASYCTHVHKNHIQIQTYTHSSNKNKTLRNNLKNQHHTSMSVAP